LSFKFVFLGAQTSLYCALSSEVKGLSGKYFENSQLSTITVKGKTEEDLIEAQEELWKISEEFTTCK
jgi:hypothetical protein